jgi:tRNA pseudouridine55 synthase
MISAPPNGLLLINKPPGITSFDSLTSIKKAFATGKVGHTGTLDKFASGLLLVLVGHGVKLANLFANCVKEYTATVFFGEETDTLDPEGKVIATGSLPTREDVEAVLPNFRGDILQAPPAYSAIHINGRRAYELVREGKEPEMKKRPCTIFELEILSWTPPEAVIHAKVSAGTYIRSLTRDIALAAGSRAHLSALKRTKVGNFRLEDAVEGVTVENLRPLDRELFTDLSLPVFLIDEKIENCFVNGRPLEGLLANGEFCPVPGNSAETAPFVGVFRRGTAGRLLGVLERRDGKWVYGHVFRE